MTTKLLSVLSATLAFSLVGCAGTDPMTGSSQNQLISVQYGRVQNIQQVAMAPDYGAGALIGGALGLLAASTGSSATQVAGAAAGAGLGALISKETAGTAERFTVVLVNGSTIDIVTENQDIRTGDCVTIEQGRHANIRRVSPVMCSTPPSNPAYQSMNNADLKESSECQEAKQELLKATTVEQTDIGYKKMRAFCES
jgi:outer membrane lipoprotein SlyB